MITGSLASLPHSEAIVSSTAFSSSLASSSERLHSRHHRSRRASGGPPPLRSVDATEKPHDDDKASYVKSSDDDLQSSANSSSDGYQVLKETQPRAAGASPFLSSTSSDSVKRDSNPARQNLRGLLEERASCDGGSEEGAAGDHVFAVTGKNDGAVMADAETSYSTSFTSTSTASSAAASPLQFTALSSSPSSSLLSSPAASPPPQPGHEKPRSPISSTGADPSNARPELKSGVTAVDAALSPEALLATLAPERLECALELYADRGGVHVGEVRDLLATLPWCTGEPAAAGAALTYLKQRTAAWQATSSSASATGSAVLLDPEVWLCAVAVAAAQSGNAAPPPASTETRLSTRGEKSPSPFVSTDTDAQKAQPTVPDRYGSSVLEESSGGISSSRRDLTAVAPRAKNALFASGDIQVQPLSPQSFTATAARTNSPAPPTPAKRKLAFDEDGVTDEEALPAGVGAGAETSLLTTQQQEQQQQRTSLPELPPRPPSSSLRSLLSQPAGGGGGGGGGSSSASLSSLAGARGPSTKRPGADTKRTREVLQQLHNSRRPPRSTPTLPGSPGSSSLSTHNNSVVKAMPPTAAPTVTDTTTKSSSSTSAVESDPFGRLQLPAARRASSPEIATPLTAASAAAVKAAEAGMRRLFQQCLCTPLAAATSMLCESDWVTLIDQRRHNGHLKLPPQAIVDDVTQTIAEEIQSRRGSNNNNNSGSGGGGGLNLSDFVRVLHRQLDEIRRDLTAQTRPTQNTTAAGTAAAAPTSTSLTFVDAAAGVEFPQHPNYLFTFPVGSNTALGGTQPSYSSDRDSSGNSTKHSPLSFPPAQAGLPGAAKRAATEGEWRVLPTWCMALAGLFPLEMSAVCPVPVVRYLRSVGLMNAVMAALVQRLELAVEAEAAQEDASVANGGGVGASSSSFSQVLSQPRCSTTSNSTVLQPHSNNNNIATVIGNANRPQLQLKEVVPASSAASSSAVGIPSPVGVSNFVWPPRANSLVSFSMDYATGQSSSSAAARPTSSVVLTGDSPEDSAQWREEEPQWQQVPAAAEENGSAAAPRAAHGPARLPQPINAKEGGLVNVQHSAANRSIAEAQGEGGRGVVDSAGRQPLSALVRSANASVHRQSSASRRYLEDRPLDEISASVVARAKARRLMDALRRNTVPINRYECFARVEHEDEPVQEPLCFVTKAELERTLGGGSASADGDNDSDATSQDSDAMSDMIKALTYDPAAAAADMNSKDNGNEDEDGNSASPSKERKRTLYTDQYRNTVRPPQLPRVSVAHLLPTVFGGSTRASGLMQRARASSSAATAASGGAGSGADPASAFALSADHRIIGLNTRMSSVKPGYSVSEAQQRPPLSAHQLHQQQHRLLPPPPPPPPVPGMYRMSGVLLGALPKQQEEALVKRLSQPLCDPRTMGLRAASASAVRPASSPMKNVKSNLSPSQQGQQAGSGLRAQSAGVRPPTSLVLRPGHDRPASSPSPHKAPSFPRQPSDPPQLDQATHHAMDTSDDLHTARTHRPSPSPRGYEGTTTAVAGQAEVLPASSAAASTPPPQLTKEQARGFAFFRVPPVLVADPLSTVAAAAAVTQVLRGDDHPATTAATSAGHAGGVEHSSAKTPARPHPPSGIYHGAASRSKQRARRRHAPAVLSQPGLSLSPFDARSSPPQAQKSRTRPATGAADAAKSTRSRSGAPRQASAGAVVARPTRAATVQRRKQSSGDAHTPRHQRKRPQEHLYNPAGHASRSVRHEREVCDGATEGKESNTGVTPTPVATHRMYNIGHEYNTTAALASEVPRRNYPSQHDGDTTAASPEEKEGVAAVVHPRNGEASASSQHAAMHAASAATAAAGVASMPSTPPPAAPMSLYERRLLWRLQRAYMAERVADT